MNDMRLPFRAMHCGCKCQLYDMICECTTQDNHKELTADEAAAPTDDGDGEKERLAERRSNFSSKRSAGDSYGATTGSAGASDVSLHRRAMHRGRSSIILKRTSSTATTDQPFDRQHSIPSLRSTASIRTRIASISRSEYHEDLKPILAAVSIISAS